MSDLISERSNPLLFTFGNRIIWTEAEDQRLMNTYKKIPKEMVMNLLPDRNWNAIKHRAYRLRIPRVGLNYTPDEDSCLIKLYKENKLTYREMIPFFKFRSLKSLKSRIYYMRNILKEEI